jgi:hypothetical protein
VPEGAATEAAREALRDAARERLRVHLAGEAAGTRENAAIKEVQAFLERTGAPANTD